MYLTAPQHAVVSSDRRHRFEADATRHRVLGALRRHRSVAVDALASPVALPSIPLGRTSSGIDRQAA